MTTEDHFSATGPLYERILSRVSAARAHALEAGTPIPPEPLVLQGGCPLCRHHPGFNAVATPQGSTLIYCSCARGLEERDAARRVLRHRAGLPALSTEPLAFSPTAAQRPAWQRTLHWIAEDRRAPWLVLLGDYGTGKTEMLVRALTSWTYIHEEAPLFLGAQTLVEICRTNIGRSRRGEPPLPEYDLARSAPLLGLDDLFAEGDTSYAEQVLSTLLFERYTLRLPTAITTNRPLQQMGTRFADRLSATVTVTLATIPAGTSYRSDATGLRQGQMEAQTPQRLTDWHGPREAPYLCAACHGRPCLATCRVQYCPEER